MGQWEPAYFDAPGNAMLFHFLSCDGLRPCNRSGSRHWNDHWMVWIEGRDRQKFGGEKYETPLTKPGRLSEIN